MFVFTPFCDTAASGQAKPGAVYGNPSFVFVSGETGIRSPAGAVMSPGKHQSQTVSAAGPDHHPAQGRIPQSETVFYTILL